MKLKIALLAAAASILLPAAASAMPFAPVVVATPIQQVRVVCDYWGRCHRLRPYIVTPQVYLAPSYDYAPGIYAPGVALGYQPYGHRHRRGW